MTVTRRYENKKGLALTDRCNVLFLKDVRENHIEAEKKRSPQPRGGTDEPPTEKTIPMNARNQSTTALKSCSSRSVRMDAVTVFQYSALTFNAHKIHYSIPWAREVEHYPQLVVQGPLNLTLLLNFWRDSQTCTCEDSSPPNTLGGSGSNELHSGGRIKKATYRATKPVFVGERYELKLENTGLGKSYLWVAKEDGTVAMKAEIEEFQEQENTPLYTRRISSRLA